MRTVPVLLAAAASALTAGALFAQGDYSFRGLPPFGVSTWTVLPCPNDDECLVPVSVKIEAGECVFTVKDIIDRHPDKKKQEMVWSIATSTPDYEVQFGHDNLTKPGIEFQLGKDDMEDKKNEKKEHRKKVKKQDTLFLTYTIKAEFKKRTESRWTKCKDKGPAIINRG